MPWRPPDTNQGLPLRERLPEGEWRTAIAEIAEEHGLGPCELTPYARGETIVWRAGEHVIKLTLPSCEYQIVAEVGCLTAIEGRLSVATPRLRAHGKLHGWPYVIMERLPGDALADVWPQLNAEHRGRLARDLGRLCRELHELPLQGFPGEWPAFWQTFSTSVGARHLAQGGQEQLLARIDSFLEKVGPLADPLTVPLHTELTDQHIYVRSVRGQFELSGLIDFADARVGAPHYEFGALVDFIFKGERGLLRQFLLAYGVSETQLTAAYSEALLAWSLCHRFANLSRTLATIGPPLPSSLEELAQRLYSVARAK